MVGEVGWFARYARSPQTIKLSKPPKPSRFFCHKANRKRIDAVPGVFGRHPFAVKHMPQMAFAIGADDFDAPHPESIVFVANDGTGYFVVERRPAATAVEFVARTVKRCVASAANIRTRRFVIPIFAGKCPFGAFFGNYMRFFGAEVIPVIHVFKILSEVKIFARGFDFQKIGANGSIKQHEPSKDFAQSNISNLLVVEKTFDSDGKGHKLYADCVNNCVCSPIRAFAKSNFHRSA
jgi:hypothetical protein